MADLNSGLSEPKAHTFYHILQPHPPAPTPMWKFTNSHMPSDQFSPRESNALHSGSHLWLRHRLNYKAAPGSGSVIGEIFLGCRGSAKPEEAPCPLACRVGSAMWTHLWPLESCDRAGAQRSFSHGLWLFGRFPGVQGLKSPPPPGRLEVWPSTLSWGPSRGTAGGKPGALPAALVWVALPLGLGRR